MNILRYSVDFSGRNYSTREVFQLQLNPFSQLHTRENWLKEARVVKQGEKAYKIVRGRPKRVS